MTAQARQQFAELLERHRGIVLRVASTYAWHAEDRVELAQEIATQLWAAFPGFDATRSFTTWMYRIALNVAISFVRREHRRRGRVAPADELPDAIADDEGAEHQLERDDRVRTLQRLIAELAPLERALLVLYLDERPHGEIGEILGITESNVATKIGRIKQRLRKLAPK